VSVDHTKNIIEIRNLSFSYGENKVLDSINLDIHPGDYLGIIGPNGGGKTTLLKLILGLLTPSSGSISLFNQSSADFQTRLKIGYVAQKSTNFDMNFPITVKEVVSMGRVVHQGLFHGGSKKDNEIIDHALDQVNLTGFQNKLIGRLSGGEQQRVFIARALAQQPEIIFLDEPTSGVDTLSQKQFYKLLKKMNQELGITLVLVSHDVDVVTNEVTEVACINQNLVYHGTPEGFIKEEHLGKLYNEGVKFVVHSHSHD
jgi:zinc transport system ATP-binding protein